MESSKNTLKKSSRRVTFAATVAVILVAVAIMTLLFMFRAKPVKAETKAVKKLVTVQAAVLTNERPSLTLFGQIESPQVQSISSPQHGYVQQVFVKTGDAVNAGQPLITLDPRDLQNDRKSQLAAIAQIEARRGLLEQKLQADKQLLSSEQSLLDIAQRDVSNAQTLYENGVGSKTSIDSAQQQLLKYQQSIEQRQLQINQFIQDNAQLDAQVNQIRADLAQIDLTIERANIKADNPAKIIEVYVSKGDRVSTGQQLLQLFDPTQVEVRAQLPENRLALINAALNGGNLINGQMEADGKTYQLQLNRLSSALRPASGGQDAYFTILGERQALALNKSVALTIYLPEMKQVLALPAQSLHEGQRVFIVDEESRLQSIYVQVVGYQMVNDNQFILVQSEQIRAGDHILTTHLVNGIDGQVVDIIESSAERPESQKHNPTL